MTLKEEIVEGGYYRTGDGSIVGPMERHDNLLYPWFCRGVLYAEGGRARSFVESSYDLISRVYVSDTPPTTQAPPTAKPEPKVGDVWRFDAGDVKILGAHPVNKDCVVIQFQRGMYGIRYINTSLLRIRVSPPMPARKVIEGWVNVYDSWSGQSESWIAFHPSKEAADKFTDKNDPNRIACVSVCLEYTEGEGL